MDTEILIVGSGFGGMCLGAKLREAGKTDFIIAEKVGEVGGTWRENTYPGAECDIPSALYSYSFAPNPTWDYKWAKQPQILKYLKAFADDYKLRPHIRFGTVITAAAFDEAAKLWTVQTNTGPIICRFFISAIGQLHEPKTPDFEGLETYTGPIFHSAAWDHKVDLSGKNVGVIGAAASAIQFIPEIAKQAKHVTVYQRTPNWVVDKGDRPYWRIEKWISKKFPALAQLYRLGLWMMGEYLIYPAIKGAWMQSTILKLMHTYGLRKAVKDPALRRKLTPDYPVGAKRILFSDKFYETLALSHVDLVDEKIKMITADGIEAGETRRGHDVIILATGFHTNPFLKNISVTGRNKVSLADHWKDGAFAYNGVAVHNFPNMFLLYGPNTNTGHTSIVFKLEQQVGYIVQLIKKAESGTAEVKAALEAAFDKEMQERLARTAWAKIDASWYKVGARVPNNWPGSSLEFKKRLAKPNWDHFILS